MCAKISIDNNMVARISSEFQKNGAVIDALHISNVGKWDGKYVDGVSESAVAKDANNAVIPPTSVIRHWGPIRA